METTMLRAVNIFTTPCARDVNLRFSISPRGRHPRISVSSREIPIVFNGTGIGIADIGREALSERR
jgi:hypothetical protein